MKGNTVKKTTGKKTSMKKQPPTWQEVVAKLPIALFHTTMGPIIGRVDKAPPDMGQVRIRLWAPALLQLGFAAPDSDATDTTMRQHVIYQPLALIETYIDLSVATPFGRSPVPEALVPSYEEYFAKFTTGGGSLRRVVAKVEQDAVHIAETDSMPASTERVSADLSPDSDVDDSEDSTVS